MNKILRPTLSRSKELKNLTRVRFLTQKLAHHVSRLGLFWGAFWGAVWAVLPQRLGEFVFLLEISLWW